MYRSRKGQQSLLEDARVFGGVKLDMTNEWIKLAGLIPWDEFEGEYAATFTGEKTGNPAKSARMALGTLLIKERYRFSDGDTVKEIQMNPYLQHFIGLPEFRHEAPFDESTITLFRQRVRPGMLTRMNDYIISLRKHKNEPDNSSNDPTAGSGDGQAEKADVQPENEGTLILDATCVPQAIRRPTDISLLNEARELLEKMITQGYKAGGWSKKPRTYCRTARKNYLRYARNRKPALKQLQKALRQQLGYVARDVGYVRELLAHNPQSLSERMRQCFQTIELLYEQQRYMFQHKTHSVDNRIVSIHQPWVRPIVRGKAAAAVEFGAKYRSKPARWICAHRGFALGRIQRRQHPQGFSRAV